jgi:hypothetical protein
VQLYTRFWRDTYVIWKTAASILKGKPTGAKLIVLSVFLLSLGAALEILVNLTLGVFSFIFAGFCTLVFGLVKYKIK